MFIASCRKESHKLAEQISKITGMGLGRVLDTAIRKYSNQIESGIGKQKGIRITKSSLDILRKTAGRTNLNLMNIVDKCLKKMIKELEKVENINVVVDLIDEEVTTK